jgi:tetratricopeptide (TPR) repeat protein
MKEVKIFYSYSHKDKKLRDKFEDHLAGLKHQGLISGWHDQMIEPGLEWKREIEKQLMAADIILLLISHHFMNSDYCYSIEMKQALERHKAGAARIIPILLSHVYLEGTPIAGLQPLPLNGRPVTSYRDRDKAFEDIVAGIAQVVSGFLDGIDRIALDLLENFKKQIFYASRSDEEWVSNVLMRMTTQPTLQNIINTTGHENLIEEIKMRAAQYEQLGEMIWIDSAIQGKGEKSKIGNIIDTIESYRSQNESFQWWFDLLAHPLVCIFDILSIHYLKLAQRALRVVLGFREYDMIDDLETLSYESTKQALHATIAYRRAKLSLERDPDNAGAYYIQCISLIGLREYNKALIAVEHVERLDPNLVGIYDLKCLILTRLGRFADALNVLEQAINSNPDEFDNYIGAKLLLEHLKKPGRWEQKVTVLVRPYFAESLLLPQVVESSHPSNALSADQNYFNEINGL